MDPIPSVTIITGFSTNCNIRINKDTNNENIFSLSGKRWAAEIVLGNDKIRPLIRIGMESIVIFSKHDSMNANPLQLLNGHSTLISPSGSPLKTHRDMSVMFDITPCIPNSLYDKRQTIPYAIDLQANTESLQSLIEHEIAFDRYNPSSKGNSMTVDEYNSRWEQFNGLQVIFDKKHDMPTLLDIQITPTVAVLDIESIKEIINFFNPKSSNSESKEVPKEEKKDEISYSNRQSIINYWNQSKPMKIRVQVAPSRLYIPSIGNNSNLNRDLMMYWDHMGILFSNMIDYPTLSDLETNTLSYLHKTYLFQLSTASVGFAIRNRSQHFSSDKTRVCIIILFIVFKNIFIFCIL